MIRPAPITNSRFRPSNVAGAGRLLEFLTARRTLPLDEIQGRLVDDVRGFEAEQHDDLTLALVRGR